jgi:hypothetical protein
VSFTNQYQTTRYLEYGQATASSLNSLWLGNSHTSNAHAGIIFIHSYEKYASSSNELYTSIS